MSKVIELARKLKELSERGIGGEKENATEKLQRLMAKHGITIEQIEEDVKKQYYFKYKKGEEKLLHQVIYMVTGGSEMYGVRNRETGRTLQEVVINCTASEMVQINEAYSAFVQAYRKEQEYFYQAFIQKNRIFPDKEDDDDDIEPSKLTREELLRINMMMEGIKRTNIHKQIDGASV